MVDEVVERLEAEECEAVDREVPNPSQDVGEVELGYRGVGRDEGGEQKRQFVTEARHPAPRDQRVDLPVEESEESVGILEDRDQKRVVQLLLMVMITIAPRRPRVPNNK
eukprot:CAMPEP_0173404868 /NCGR_PEP_ID=MMETSP1356-20130122/60498_1 /TAXON_ID=77927 ORGANISM="Hemiselmis virescens, Strain PCC157" /NCGR_SAMPLE_ID=MMETSP1356 /ASSEMBLY_ACC=CAM_ASM_000847 /LENGTH=108 /DNA_ID=CAMNT_0014365605 /DNA_START=578 /DNA_END=904 /DNA_ORIENTATION=+